MASDKPVARTLRRLGGMLASWCLLLAVGGSAAEAGLVFKRADGSAIRFAGTPRVWCGPWETDVARPSVHVAVGSVKHRWHLSAVRRDLTIGRRIRFPNDFVWNRPRGALLFVADGANEASTAEEGELRLDGVLSPDVSVFAAGSWPSASRAASGASIPTVNPCGCPAPTAVGCRHGRNAT